MQESYDPRELLGVSSSASADDIRKAFRRKAKLAHPDVSQDPDAEEQFKRLTAARDLLLERISNPTAPTPPDLHRPAKTVSERERDLALKEFRRRREADERRRDRRRRAAREQAERVAERTHAEQERLAHEQAERREQEERERREQAQRAEQERLERLRREEAERRERALRERKRTQRQVSAPTQHRQTKPPETQLRCAWKGCSEFRNLAEPVRTALGSRRFCATHRVAYIEFNAKKSVRRN